jgi:hypothetical protein
MDGLPDQLAVCMWFTKRIHRCACQCGCGTVRLLLQGILGMFVRATIDVYQQRFEVVWLLCTLAGSPEWCGC